jgi:hypothetical protein
MSKIVASRHEGKAMSRKQTRPLTTLATLLLCVLFRCGDESGGQDAPIPALTKIRSMGGQPGGRGPIDIVGLDSATAGAGKVTITAPFEDKSVEATNSGSFFATIPAKEGEVIEIQYKGSAPAKLTVPRFIDIYPGPDLVSNETPITKPVGGETTIVGTGPAELALTVVNKTTGSVVVSKVAASGTFRVPIAASSGDVIRSYLDVDPMGPPWELPVP